MILSEISLENIRSHNITKVEFSEGVNIITGNTGSGKSSILMAVEYALFGKIGEGKDEGRILLRRNAKEGRVTLRITDGHSGYEISRGLKRVNDAVRNDDSKNYVNKDETRVDLQNRASDINSYVGRILNISAENPLKMFETITYIKQDELKNLIFETGQYKQEYIDGLLQLNKYLSVYESMREILGEIKNEIDIDRKEIELSIDENEIIKTESKINENKNKIEEIKKQEYDENLLLENKKIGKKQKESEVEFERAKKLKFTRMSTEIKMKEEEKEKLHAEISKIRERIEEDSSKILNFDEKKKESLENGLRDLERTLNTENEKVKKTYGELYKAEYSYKSAIKDKESLAEEEKREKSRVSELKKEIDELEAQISTALDSENKDEIKGRISEIEKMKNEIESEMETAFKSGICQVCGAEITSKEHIEEEYGKKIKRCEAGLSVLRSNYENIKLSKNELEKRLEALKIRLSAENEKLSGLEERLLALDEQNKKAEYEEIKRRYEEENEKLEELSAEFKRLREEDKLLNEQEKMAIEIKRNSSRMKDLEESITSASNYVEKLQFEIKDINFDEGNLEILEKELKLFNDEMNAINDHITELRKEKEMRERQLSDDENTLKEFEIKIKKKKDVTERLAGKERLFKLMSSLREDIRNIREYVRLRFINEFRSLFKTRFEELRNESDYSIDIDKNYNVVISAGKEEMDARTLSGGEKTSVAIAYRLALSSLASILGGVGKNELILMDEPTAGLDKEDINALTNAITRINDLKQIIIVTHEDSMKNIADNVIKLKKDGGVSVLY